MITSAAAIATNHVFHSKTKHFEIDLHFIKDKVTRGELEISFVAGRDQIANVLTKPLPYYKFSCFRSKLKVFDKTLCLREGVENTNHDHDQSSADLSDTLACHLSYTYSPADTNLMRWQNCYIEEYQHMG